MRLEAWQAVAMKTMEAGASQVAQLKQAGQEQLARLAAIQAECDGIKARCC